MESCRKKSLTVAMLVDRHVRRLAEERIAQEQREEAAHGSTLCF